MLGTADSTPTIANSPTTPTKRRGLTERRQTRWLPSTKSGRGGDSDSRISCSATSARTSDLGLVSFIFFRKVSLATPKTSAAAAFRAVRFALRSSGSTSRHSAARRYRSSGTNSTAATSSAWTELSSGVSSDWRAGSLKARCSPGFDNLMYASSSAKISCSTVDTGGASKVSGR